MNKKDHVLAMTAAATLAMAAPPAFAADSPSQAPLAVAVVDADVSKIDFDDPNVRFVHLDPAQKNKLASRDASVNHRFSHGDIVASSFVKEYRKLEPTRPIVIYAVNPMRDAGSGMVLSLGAVRAAMPALQAANVKVAITSFGTESQEGGEKFLAPFRSAGIAVFAAVPNEPTDPGIFPAASKNAISVGCTEEGGFFDKSRDAKKWVNFVSEGMYSSGSTRTVRGSSFAVAQVAAYGALFADRNPGITLEGMRSEIAAVSDKSQGQAGLVGLRPMITRSLAAAAAQEQPALAQVAPVIKPVDGVREAGLSAAVHHQVQVAAQPGR